MIQSMTGFARKELIGTHYQILIEMKSVNGRYKDIRFKIPNILNSYEFEAKKIVEKFFERGSIDIFVTLQKKDKSHINFSFDSEKIQKFLTHFESLVATTGVGLTVNPVDFLRVEFALENEKYVDEINALFLRNIDEVCLDLKKRREEEGQKLVHSILENIQEFKISYKKICELKSELKDIIEKKLKDALSQHLSVSQNDPRYFQEVLFYLEKLDIDEELVRLESHLDKMENLLSQNKGAIGRSLDFFLQELNREINTIGSKSSRAQISELVVDCKIRLEKMREMALNLQ